tara:strand:+ start:976 stop:1227 length:252 start_codon:yes stop_codon:yes gene_type:complete
VNTWLILTAFISTVFGVLGVFFGKGTSKAPEIGPDDEEMLRRAVRLRELLEERLAESTGETAALLEEEVPEQAIASEFNKRKG